MKQTPHAYKKFHPSHMNIHKCSFPYQALLNNPTLHLKGHKEEELLVHDNEREWGSWKDTFRTRYQEHGINFIPLKDVGYEHYQVYFPIED